MIELNGLDLSLEDVERVAHGDVEVRLADAARGRMLASRRTLEELVASGATVYGVTTGVGARGGKGAAGGAGGGGGGVRGGLGGAVPLHFPAFHPDAKMTELPATPAATVERARRIAADMASS